MKQVSNASTYRGMSFPTGEGPCDGEGEDELEDVVVDDRSELEGTIDIGVEETVLCSEVAMVDEDVCTWIVLEGVTVERVVC